MASPSKKSVESTERITRHELGAERIAVALGRHDAGTYSPVAASLLLQELVCGNLPSSLLGP